MTLCAGQLQFIDCFKFLNFPQGMPASKLKTKDLILTGKDRTKNELKLLCRKGVYTFKYVNYHKRFNKTELPPKKIFLYSTLPGIFWDKLLKKTKIKLDLLTVIYIHLFVEKGLRCGISIVSKRYATAINTQ